MIELEDAVQRIVSGLPPAQKERVNLLYAFGRIVAEPVHSPVDLPIFDNSAMDGYALRAEDATSASKELPAKLRITGKIAAGDTFQGEVRRGECTRIFTGSPMPRGADAVVMQEDTELRTSDPGSVFATDTVRPWENVRLKGQDVRAGSLLVRAGEGLTAGMIALL